MRDIGPGSNDLLCRCVAARRRREVVSYLRAREDETATLDDLVDAVVSLESETNPSDRDKVARDLYHVHLPMLADAGVIEFDPRSKAVRYGRHPEFEGLVDATENLSAGPENE